MSARLLFAFAVPQQVREGLQVVLRLAVSGFRVVERDIDDEDDFLPDVVERDDLVKQHQVRVAEPFGVDGLPPDGRFAVTEVIVGEVPDESAREGRQSLQPRAFIVREDRTND